MEQPEDRNTTLLSESIEEVTFDDVCTICHIHPDFIIELIAYGTIEPHGTSIKNWRFDPHQVHIIRTATRLHHDLEVNHAGIALAIDLLQQLRDLKNELNILKKYFSN